MQSMVYRKEPEVLPKLSNATEQFIFFCGACWEAKSWDEPAIQRTLRLILRLLGHGGPQITALFQLYQANLSVMCDGGVQFFYYSRSTS